MTNLLRKKFDHVLLTGSKSRPVTSVRQCQSVIGQSENEECLFEGISSN